MLCEMVFKIGIPVEHFLDILISQESFPKFFVVEVCTDQWFKYWEKSVWELRQSFVFTNWQLMNLLDCRRNNIRLSETCFSQTQTEAGHFFLGIVIEMSSECLDNVIIGFSHHPSMGSIFIHNLQNLVRRCFFLKFGSIYRRKFLHQELGEFFAFSETRMSLNPHEYLEGLLEFHIFEAISNHFMNEFFIFFVVEEKFIEVWESCEFLETSLISLESLALLGVF